MIEKIKKHQRLFLIGLIVICTCIMALGAVVYLQKIKDKLMDNAIQDVINVTLQQRQAVDNFISGDRERLHSYAEHFAGRQDITTEDVQERMEMVKNADSVCAVICLDEGLLCSNAYPDIRQIDEEHLEIYSSLSGSGVWDNFIGAFSERQMFGFYETFTFKNGHRGLFQKVYERSKVLETFTLSIYNGQGYGYILNPEGDILLRSVLRGDNQTYDNIFGALSNAQTSQADIDAFRASLEARETGSIVFQGNNGDQVFTFAPIESVDGWYMLSIVPKSVIQDETNSILRDSQMIMGFFALILVICATFIFLIWRTQKEIKAKELENAYQSQLFDASFTFLAQNTDDLYIIFDHETEKLEYISPNVERVLGITPEELVNRFQAADMAADEDIIAYYTEVRALRPGEMVKPKSTEHINHKTGEHKYFLENAYCVDILIGTTKVPLGRRTALPTMLA